VKKFVGLVVLGIVGVAAACVADDPNTDAGPSDDASTSSDAGGDSNPSASVPTHGAAAVAFVDVDPKVGTIGGTIRITKAASESDVTSYAIYSGDKNGSKTSPTPIATLTAANKNLTYHLAEGTMPQPGVTSLLVFTQNAAGEMATGVTTPLTDATPHYVPIPIADAGAVGGTSRIVFDEANRKLLIVTSHPYLFRCELDGTGCVQSDLSGSDGGAANYLQISASIDTANNKLLVVASDQTNQKPVLFRSNLDGSSPGNFDISAGRPTGSAAALSTFIDTTRSKLLVAAGDYSGSTLVPALFTSNLDGSGATYQNVSTGTTEPGSGQPGNSPSVVVDDVNSKYLLVTADTANDSNPSLWICPIAGGDCSRNNVVTDTSVGLGNTTQILLDAAASKIDIVTSTVGNAPLLFRCNLDGSNCGKIDPTAGTTAGTAAAQGATAVLDVLDGKIGIFTEDRSNSDKPALFRCNTDGSSCTYTDVSASAAVVLGSLSITVDPETGQLFGVTSNTSASDQPSLFYLQ
jgi:hypothetical protein